MRISTLTGALCLMHGTLELRPSSQSPYMMEYVTKGRKSSIWGCAEQLPNFVYLNDWVRTTFTKLSPGLGDAREALSPLGLGSLLYR